ncbi:helix-turn-helix transcriptional regulator [Streptomyces longisporoflavus]|uniref:Helix-turn-helix transcriptional regulator n=1 Tax=Streptomyces longisporoflavus TaxID=28044 RepID=A0ABW7QZJ8_9ACTN
MALRTTVTERQRRIGAELKKLREQAKLTVSEAGASIGMGRVHLTHVEGGHTAIPPERIRTLCQSYGVTCAPYIDELVSMALSDGKGWWSSYRKTMRQRALDLAELESRATALQGYETLVIPGLLQTESYMRALFRDSLADSTPDEVDTLVQFRMERQSILSPPQSAQLHVVIHEAALRVVIGSRHVMQEQITHLLTAARFPNLTIQVRPFDAGSSRWISAPFSIVRPGAPGLETVVAEHPSARLNLDDREEISQYSSTFDSLRKTALAPVVADHPPEAHAGRDSCTLLQHLLYTHQGNSYA